MAINLWFIYDRLYPFLWRFVQLHFHGAVTKLQVYFYTGVPLANLVYWMWKPLIKNT
jgi:hypothetical protein